MNQSESCVAHIDILGMSKLVEKNFDDAWGVLSDLVHVRNEQRFNQYEFTDKGEIFKVAENIHFITFSDTLFLFTNSTSPIELKSLIILVTEIFHKALFNCVPVRAGIGLGRFNVNFEESMFAGPALIDAYYAGENAKWLGITFSEPAGKAASTK